MPYVSWCTSFLAIAGMSLHLLAPIILCVSVPIGRSLHKWDELEIVTWLHLADSDWFSTKSPSLLSILATHCDFVRKVFSSNTMQYFSQPLCCSLFAVQLLPFLKCLKGAFLRITSGFFLDDLNMVVWNSQQPPCPAIVVAGGQLRTESLKHCISRYALAPLPIWSI